MVISAIAYMLMLAAASALAFVFVFSLFSTVYAFDSPIMFLKSSFVDSDGRINIVGTVRNYAQTPMHVTVGIKTDDGKIIQAPTYGRVIWPLTDSPFKIVLARGVNGSDPFIIDMQEAKVPNYDSMLILNYGSMAVGQERAFVGTIKNVGQFEVHNVSVYAGIHTIDHKSQLDTVKSNVISTIKPGEQVGFTALPDPAVRQNVFYYSCAGIDLDAPITTMATGDGGFIPYTLNAVAQISSMRYDNSTDSIVFGIRPYTQDGAMNLQIPQRSQNQIVAVMLDGKPHDASITGDGNTMNIHLSIPQGDHEVQIQGVRNLPEFPFAMIAFAGFTGLVIALARYKAALKIY